MRNKQSISTKGIPNKKKASPMMALGVVVFASILTTSSAQARYRMAPVEVVVYQGAPIDYSNRADVIVIENSVPMPSYLEEISTPQVANAPVPKANNIASKPKQANPAKTVASVNRAKQVAQQRQRAQPAIRSKQKQQSKNRLALAIKKKPATSAKSVFPEVQGKDPVLVAFYYDILRKQEERRKQKKQLPTQIKQTTTLAVKKEVSKNIQLSRAKTTGKDPELVEFYNLVFGKETNESEIEQAIDVAKTKNKNNQKDPELVAFYHLVFGKKQYDKKQRDLAAKGNKKSDTATS